MNINLVIPVLGTPIVSLDIIGRLPASVDLVREYATAVITGIPSENGVYRSVLTAANQYGTASADLILTVADPAIITTAALPDAVKGEPYSFKFSSLYGVNLLWSESGDVLAGIMGAFMAFGKTSFEIACLAVYLHGLSGDKAAEDKGKHSMVASDIILGMEDILRQI